VTRKQNALDWYHEEHCSQCDRPTEECKEGRGQEIACILAAILKAIEEK